MENLNTSKKVADTELLSLEGSIIMKLDAGVN
jgi:hypothetical protein